MLVIKCKELTIAIKILPIVWSGISCVYSNSCGIFTMRTIVVLAFCLVLFAVAVDQIEAKCEYLSEI